MEADGEQNPLGASANQSTASGAGPRPSTITSMSLYERQAVQALQALQRQPHAAQYFQQLMLQQQISSAQLHNLAAVQQASVTASGGGASSGSRPIGPGASTTSTISQSVLLSGTAGGQGHMYLRVNRSLRAPLSSQLIFMPGATATAAVATVTQQTQTQQQQQQHQQQEVAPGSASSSSGSQSESDQVQNLALRGSSGPKGAGVKTEASERESAPPTLHPPRKPSPPQLPHIKIPTYPQPSALKPHHPSSSSSSSSSSSIPLSQLLLHGPRAITAVTAAAAATHILVPACSAAQQRPPLGGAGVAGVRPGGGAQTLVVQPLQKASLAGDKPVPIQPKTLHGVRLPLHLPSRNPPPILPSPAPPSSSAPPAPAPLPYIPVQIVGARQSSPGTPQALAREPGMGSPGPLGASRGGGAAGGRGLGLKTLRPAPQEAQPPAPVSHVHPQNQRHNGPLSSARPPPSVSCPPPCSSRPPVAEEQGGVSPLVGANGESTGGDQTQAPVSLKRKSEDDGPAPSRPPSSPIREQPRSPARTDPGSPPPSQAPPPQELSICQGGKSPPSQAPAAPRVGVVLGDAAPPARAVSVSRVGVAPGDKALPPQAVVRPSVLTHLIEGFVIQEGAEPFPVCGSAKEPPGDDSTADSPDTNQSEGVVTARVLKCEYCHTLAPATRFRGTKRFCSMTCAKRYNVSCRQHFRLRAAHGPGHSPGHSPGHGPGHGPGQGPGHGPGHGPGQGPGHLQGVVRRRVPRRTSSEIASAKIAGRPLPAKCRSESSQSDEGSSEEEEEEEDNDDDDDDDEANNEEEDEPMRPSPATSISCHQAPPRPASDVSAPVFLPGSPSHWSVEEVTQFISSLQGCEDLASHFLSQEIDGQALLLLREEHLMSTMNIKLGPALKICAHINTLRD